MNIKITNPQSPPFPLTDIAIIGGGVSGAYTAYRLMKANPNESPVLKRLLELSGREQIDVRLFELSDRIGGRLCRVRASQLGLTQGLRRI
ncbi:MULTISPECIES: NAD(P)-binding protein [unclassified Microcoleus]|uniref:NAD(P)-binding protein n=1 Tax=unclassified Microcoleus TaxID=2642155 RepID=UPI002FD233D9